jgi:hypothetical protein
MSDQRSTRKSGHYATGEPSVTTILKVLDKPDLTRWLQMEIFNATLDGAKDFTEASNKVRAISLQAMDIGTRVHTFVEHLGKGIVPIKYPDLMLYYKAYHQWTLDYKPVILENEITVTSKKLGYKGTLDLLVEIDGKKKLVDLKTGKGIYESVELQASAYRQAYEEERPGERKIDENWVLLLEKGDNGLPTGEYKFGQLEYVPEIFNATLEIYKWSKEARKR